MVTVYDRLRSSASGRVSRRKSLKNPSRLSRSYSFSQVCEWAPSDRKQSQACEQAFIVFLRTGLSLEVVVCLTSEDAAPHFVRLVPQARYVDVVGRHREGWESGGPLATGGLHLGGTPEGKTQLHRCIWWRRLEGTSLKLNSATKSLLFVFF